MSLHPLQLPTGQGHLKIKSVLAWQPFLVEQSPSYHEVIRWLTPSHGRAWVAGDHPLPVFWGVGGGFGAGESCARWWMETWCAPLCLHGVPTVPAGDQEWAQVFPELAWVTAASQTGRWQTRFGHLLPRMCPCFSLFFWNLELCLCGKSFSPSKESQLEGTCSRPSTCVRKPSPSEGCWHSLGSRSKAWF